jgi:AraC family transcriptional activator of pyochelin receptor
MKSPVDGSRQPLPVSLAQLARNIGINEHKLKNGFKQQFGITVFAYIREQRLTLAKQLLEQTNLDEAAIAKKVGFRSLPNFINAFKKQYHHLPHHYRSK